MNIQVAVFFICFIQNIFILYSQNILIPYRSCDKWGFVKVGTKTQVVTPQYDTVGIFIEGRAWVKKGNFYGYIDEKGNLIIDAEYEFASDFIYPLDYEYQPKDSSRLYARVEKNGRMFTINRHGKEIIPINQIICGNGIERKLPMFHSYKAQGKYGLSRFDNSIISPPIFDEIIAPLQEGAFVLKNGKWGFIANENNLNVDFEWDKYQLFEDEYTFITDLFSNTCFAVCKDNKWALINRNGKLVTEYKYEGIKGQFQENYFIAKVKYLGGKGGFIDMYGNEYFEDSDCQNK